jgi:membrane fusion protein, copper/silver efflux system
MSPCTHRAGAASWLVALCGLLAGALLVAALPSRSLFVDPQRADAAAGAGERWACPMMDFIGGRAGTCPVCGMQLERMTSGEVTREQQRRMGVTTVRVAEAPATVVVRAYGAAEYDDRSSQVVIARIGGRIVKRHEATFGCCQEVLVGDPIVALYSPEAFQAQGELAAAMRAGNAELVQALEARFARWNLSHVAQAIKDGKPPSDTVTILSPVGGQAYLDDQAMVNSTLMIGSEITADMPLLKLVDPNRLVLVFHVPEPRAHFLSEGQRVLLSSDDLGELPEIEAVIGRVSNELNPQIRAREVRVYLTGGRRKLLPGSLLNARIQAVLGADLAPADPTDRSTWGSFPVVPKTAILSTGVRSVAWRVKSRSASGAVQFELASVALGPRLEDEEGNDRYVIRAGLRPGDEIAAQAQFLIDSQAQLAGSASLLFPDGATSTSSPHAVTPPAAAPAHQH